MAVLSGTESASAVDLKSTSYRTHIVHLCVFVYVPFCIAWAVYWLVGKRGKVSERFRVGLLCYSWVTMSIGMHTLNKSLVTWLNAPGCITVAQMAIAAFAMISFHWDKLALHFVRNRSQVIKWLIVPSIFAGMLLSSIFTYKYISLSVMTVVRNLAPLVALPVELFIMPPGKRPTVSIESIGAMAAMLFGAVIYSLSAPSISGLGILFAVANMLLAICDRMVQRRLLAEDCPDLPLEVCTFINNFVGILPSVIVMFLTNEVAHTIDHHSKEWLRMDTILFLILSGVLGLGICYFGLAVQRAISATSFLVLNNLSKFAVVSVGISVFGDPIKSHLVVAGLMFSLLGSVWYGISQIKSQAAPPLTQDEEEVHAPLVPNEIMKKNVS